MQLLLLLSAGQITQSVKVLSTSQCFLQRNPDTVSQTRRDQVEQDSHEPKERPESSDILTPNPIHTQVFSTKVSYDSWLIFPESF